MQCPPIKNTLWWGRLTAHRADVSPFPWLMQGAFCCLRSFFLFFYIKQQCIALYRKRDARSHTFVTTLVTPTVDNGIAYIQCLRAHRLYAAYILLTHTFKMTAHLCECKRATQPSSVNGCPSRQMITVTAAAAWSTRSGWSCGIYIRTRKFQCIYKVSNALTLTGAVCTSSDYKIIDVTI